MLRLGPWRAVAAQENILRLRPAEAKLLEQGQGLGRQEHVASACLARSHRPNTLPQVDVVNSRCRELAQASTSQQTRGDQISKRLIVAGIDQALCLGLRQEDLAALTHTFERGDPAPSRVIRYATLPPKAV